MWIVLDKKKLSNGCNSVTIHTEFVVENLGSIPTEYYTLKEGQKTLSLTKS